MSAQEVFKDIGANIVESDVIVYPRYNGDHGLPSGVFALLDQRMKASVGPEVSVRLLVGHGLRMGDVAIDQPFVRHFPLPLVRPTPGISCRRSIDSATVSFMPLLDRLVALRVEDFMPGVQRGALDQIGQFREAAGAGRPA